MTNEEFRLWRGRLRLTDKTAALELGVSQSVVRDYVEHASIPRYIELACRELERRQKEREARSVMQKRRLPSTWGCKQPVSA